MHQQTLRIDENVPLLAFDLLARIIAMGVDAGPPLWMARPCIEPAASLTACH
jgi:hypothetical protein